MVVATPTTLVALLRAIAYGWQQDKVATNAEGIRKLGSELYDRLRTLASHFDSVGTALGRAVNAYNAFVGSMETRVLPSARRFRDLGAAGGDDIAPLAPIEQAPRQRTRRSIRVSSRRADHRGRTRNFARCSRPER